MSKAMSRPEITGERALEIVREVAEKEGPYAREVAALAVCVNAIESLPAFSRKRVIDHLSGMFEGAYALDLLVALVTENADVKAELQKMKNTSDGKPNV